VNLLRPRILDLRPGAVKLEADPVYTANPMATLADSLSGNQLTIEFLNLAPTRLSRKELADLPYWMDIRCTVQTRARSWSGTSEALTASEVEGVADFLRAWSEMPPAEDTRGYMEPNLAIRKVPSEGPRISFEFGFGLEFHPDRPPEMDEPHWVEFNIDPDDLRRFADDLLAELHRIAPGMAS
jgi:hypothetical protein